MKLHTHTKRGPAPVKVQNKRGNGEEKGIVFVATVRSEAHQNSSPHHVKFQNESGAGGRGRSNDMRMLWLQKAC